MCVIVDTQVVHKVFRTPSEDFKPLYDHIADGRIRVVYGGKLGREYARIDWFRKLLLRLDQQGSAWRVSDAEVDAEAARLHSGRMCRSNDHHVIALARVSRTRLICTEDDDLIQDFKNKTILNKPRGKVYREASHVRLLRSPCRPLDH
jgi:predicted nucleic acid-binding protein